MKGLIQSLQERSLGLISHLPYSELKLPPEFQSVSKPEINGDLRLQNSFFDIKNIGQIRNVTITSEKINVFNFMFYPEPMVQLPVYASEFVCLSDKPIVAVIDAKCLVDMPLGNCVKRLLIDTRAKINYEQANNDPSDWFDQCKSGLEILIRPTTMAQLLSLFESHLEVWQGIVRLFKTHQQTNKTISKTHAENIARYKRQHSANYPGLPLLIRSFGPAWSSAYLDTYLFG